MIRVLHFADLHLGIENYGRLNPATGLHSRVEDFLAALDHIVDHATDGSIDAVLFAGDAYKTKDPTVTLQREFAKRIARLSRANIPTVLLTGNHDSPVALGRATSLEIFRTLAIPPVYVVSRVSIVQVPTRSGVLQVVCLPWLHRGQYVEGATAGQQPLQEETAAIGDLAEQWLAGIPQHRDYDPTNPTVALVHATVRGAVLGSERQLILGSDLEVTAASLDQPWADYVALGHIHKQQVIPGATRMAYAGSLERVDFGEEDDAKGYIVAEVERGAVARATPLRWSAREFLTIEVKLGDDGSTNDVVNAINQQSINGKVVRVSVAGPAAVLAKLHAPDILIAVRPAYAFGGLKRLPDEDARLRATTVQVASMSVADVLAHYYDRRNVPMERRALLAKAADELIKEEAGEQ